MARGAAARAKSAEQETPPPRHLTAVETPFSATTKDVQKFAEGLSESYLQCRELGHNWRTASGGAREDGTGYFRLLRCNRCRTKREQDLDSRGMIIGTKMIYPDGYLTKGMGRIMGDGRGLLRLESVKRTLNKG